MELPELLITTSRSSPQASASVFDPTTGSVLHTYKNGGTVAPKTLTLIGNDYVLSVNEDKPMTHMWPINSQEPDKRLGNILADKVSCLSLCPKSTYLAAAIGVKLYIWQLNSGKLLAIQKKNFQPITCIEFSSDGSLVIVAGEDGMLVVYRLVDLVSLHTNMMSQNEGQVAAVYAKHDHSLPITDIHVGTFGDLSRLVTVSSDNTCKLYVLYSGELLLNLVFEEPLTSVVFDGPCWNLYVGQNSGKIQQFHLKEPPRKVDHHVAEDLVFQGHQKKITCLELGVSSGLLFSGSDDNFVFIWEISSRQILRRMEHKGAITNVRCILRHGNFFAQNLKARTVVRNLDRFLVDSEEFVVGIIPQDFEIESSDDEWLLEEDFGMKTRGTASRDLEEENARLRAINQQLYEAAMNNLRKSNKF